MGSVCCVAVKDRKVPPSSGGHAGAALHRNSACSPQWSFRRDNRRRVADEIEGSPYYSPYVGSRGISMDKMSLGSLSEGGTPPDGHLGTPASQKSATPEMGTNSIVPPSSDSSLASHDPIEVKNLVDSLSIVPSALPKPVFSMPSLSPPVCDLSSAHSRLLPPKSTPSRRARRSPGHQLFRQVSDSQILGLKSPNNNYSVSEGRSSFVLSTCSNDFANGSNYASSEGGWSLNTFSELVAYSQRERWSFDSEQLDSGRRKLSGGSSRFSFSPSVVVDQQTCGACSKLLTERSSIATFELPIAAVLACGHVYHAECLETMTTEIEKYDPACPICTIGEKRVAKITRKALKAEAEAKAKHYKRCKNRVVDSYGESECDEFMFQKTGRREGKALKMEPSSSSKGPSKSFLKWHFASISSKWSKPSSKDSALKKGFWSRHRNNNRSSSSSIEGLNQTSQL
uniref:RING-type domain-containing protein n=1 Tax=Noccaea caerulescens TaxID=107243 RepID=A0A1J3D8A6_NOCCA